MIFCVHTQEGKGLVVSGTERHEHLFVVRACTYVRLRQLWVFVTRENASLAHLINVHNSFGMPSEQSYLVMQM